MDASLAQLPKVELHLHGEADGRLDRILARRAGNHPFDWTNWARRLYAHTPPGMPRLQRLRVDRRRTAEDVEALDAEPENFIERVVDVLDEAGVERAIYVEVRFGISTLRRPELLPLFREAARVGLAGIDIIPDPYDTEAEWSGVGEWTARAADAGLGVTVHAGEFSTTNIAHAARLPGASRRSLRGRRRGVDRRVPRGRRLGVVVSTPLDLTGAGECDTSTGRMRCVDRRVVTADTPIDLAAPAQGVGRAVRCEASTDRMTTSSPRERRR
jgi:hypothetical protein